MQNVCVLFLVMFSISQLCTDTMAIKCYQCISPNSLGSNWYLSGLPLMPQAFLAAEDEAICQNMKKPDPIHQVDCHGHCVSMIVQADPKWASILAGQTGNIVIRGCHEHLIAPNVIPNPDKCQYGSVPYGFITIDNNQQRPTDINALVKYCNDADLCNKDDGSPTLAATQCQGYTKTPIDCVRCNGNAENCSPKIGDATDQARCQGYCFKTVQSTGSQTSVVKGCAKINPYQENTCKKWSSKATLLTAALVDITVENCYCDSNNCNGAIRFVRKSPVDVAMLLLITFIICKLSAIVN